MKMTVEHIIEDLTNAESHDGMVTTSEAMQELMNEMGGAECSNIMDIMKEVCMINLSSSSIPKLRIQTSLQTYKMCFGILMSSE